MASGFKNSSSVDLDNIFSIRAATDPSTNVTGYVTSDGLDLAARYYPLQAGMTPLANTGFKTLVSGVSTDLCNVFAPPPVWTNLGLFGMASVSSVFVFNSNNVFLGGGSTNKLKRLQKYNGSSIVDVSPYNIGETGQSIQTVAAFSANNILFGGSFTTIYNGPTTSDFITVNGIGKFNGTTNVSIGYLSISAFVRHIFILNSTYAYIGGSFTSVSGTTGYNGIALYNTTTNTLSNIGAPPAGTVNSIYAVSLNEVYTIISTRVYKYNGTSWTLLITLVNIVDWIHGIGSDVYITGRFRKTEFTPNITSDYVARWNGTQFEGVGSGPPSGGRQIYVFSSNNIVVNPSSVVMSRWDGSSWSALGTGGPSDVIAMHANGTRNLFAAAPNGNLYKYG